MDNPVNVFGSISLTLSKESVEAAVASQLGGSLTGLADLVSQLSTTVDLMQRTSEMQRQRIETLESKVADAADLEDKVSDLESKVEDMDFDDLDNRVDDLERSMRTVEDLPSEDEIVTTDNIGDIISDLDIGGDIKMTVEDLRHQVESLMSLRQKLIDVLVPAVSEPVVSEPVVSEPEPAPVF